MTEHLMVHVPYLGENLNCLWAKLSAQSQVPKLQHPPGTDQYVCRFDVPVQYASSMQGLQGVDHLPQRSACQCQQVRCIQPLLAFC